MTSTSAPPAPAALPRLPTWWGVWARSAGSGSLIIATISLFMVMNRPGALGEQLATFALTAQAIIALIALPLSSFIGAPYASLTKLLDAGVPAEQLPRAKVITALRLPTRVFSVVLGAHVVFAGVFVVVSRFSDVLARFDIVRDVIIGAVALGFISATAQAYLMGRVVHLQITPLLLPRGRLDHLVVGDEKLPHTFVWQHLALLVVNLAFAWPALMWTFLHTPGDPGRDGYAVLGLLWFVLVGGQAVGIMAAVSRSVGHLAARMTEVHAGRLDVQARVYDLDTFGLQASDFNRMVEGLRQREELKETFGRYVTQQVVAEILAGRVALGGELKTATVLFSDIRGFTRMSEKLTPQEVVAFLNEYLAAMVDVVIEHGGVLDKFIGDAVMAVFGVPVGKGSAEEDAFAAVACAVAMGKKLDEMNARRAEAGKAPIAIGIGVHTGELVAGNIGSPRRMQYTVIGDTVNVGSRLESLTKEHARRTLLSGATVALVKGKFNVVEVGRVVVRGRDETLQIFGLADELPLVVNPH